MGMCILNSSCHFTKTTMSTDVLQTNSLIAIVSGYIRSIVDEDQHVLFPNDIILLISQRIDTRLYITITGDDLKDFLSKNVDTSMDQTYTVELYGNMVAECHLVPRNLHLQSVGLFMVMLDVKIKELGSSTTNTRYHVYTECGCLEIPNSLFK